jgi:hypothetical protein
MLQCNGEVPTIIELSERGRLGWSLLEGPGLWWALHLRIFHASLDSEAFSLYGGHFRAVRTYTLTSRSTHHLHTRSAQKVIYDVVAKETVLNQRKYRVIK